MNLELIKERAKKIVDPKGDYGCEITETAKGFEIEFFKEYHRPNITFALLKAISEEFLTEEVDIYSGRTREGCITCDHGSQYGVIIVVNNPRLKRLVDENKIK